MVVPGLEDVEPEATLTDVGRADDNGKEVF